MPAVELRVGFSQVLVLGFELLQLMFEVLDVFLFAFPEGPLGGTILSAAANTHVGGSFFVVLGAGAGGGGVGCGGSALGVRPLGLLRMLPPGSVVGLELGQVVEFNRIYYLWCAVVIGAKLTGVCLDGVR